MAKKRNKIKSKPEPGFKVKINHTQYTDATREATEDQWDADDLSHSHSFEGFSLSDGYFDFVLNEAPDPEKDYYLVWVSYSTGDSFHHEDGCICMVAFVKDYEDASTIHRAIENDYKHKHEVYGYSPLNVNLPKAKTRLSIGTSSWKGYFERLQSVHIERLMLVP